LTAAQFATRRASRRTLANFPLASRRRKQRLSRFPQAAFYFNKLRWKSDMCFKEKLVASPFGPTSTIKLPLFFLSR
jgi:hypothetical protein